MYRDAIILACFKPAFYESAPPLFGASLLLSLPFYTRYTPSILLLASFEELVSATAVDEYKVHSAVCCSLIALTVTFIID